MFSFLAAAAGSPLQVGPLILERALLTNYSVPNVCVCAKRRVSRAVQPMTAFWACHGEKAGTRLNPELLHGSIECMWALRHFPFTKGRPYNLLCTPYLPEVFVRWRPSNDSFHPPVARLSTAEGSSQALSQPTTQTRV